ncbi:ATP-dependent DNA ligase [Chryseolinea sp. H1M3-3]|uniref:ATP-dependent DNA ligase n=1 Tax=Chryseolinea sp. H1M3-3 TaxID=3034144 RepID=UPI0023ED35CA|nr:ATP-dependent DNA ligase [Chryseolinea sp. H1M3-3]
MKYFTQLFTTLDQTTKTLDKIKALASYFEKANDRDKLWAIALLSHRRPKRSVNATLLALWASELSHLPEWLFVECHAVVGDLAETISLVLPEPTEVSDQTLTEWIEFIKALEPLTVDQKKEKILWAWNRLEPMQRFVFNKLITGGFRIGVSQSLMVKALAKHAEVKENVIAHRLMGNWSPEYNNFQELVLSDDTLDLSRPYPFYLAYALEGAVSDLGNIEEWQAEWKWDGIRGQVIVRDRELFVWSRGEELVTDKYPEFTVMLDLLPDGTAIDGEILPFKNDLPLPFSKLQTRIGRKTLSQKQLKEVPVAFVAYDLLEWKGEDVREWPLSERRNQLAQLCSAPSSVLRLSPTITVDSWESLAAERTRARELFSEGIMLKRKSSVYRAGRRRGDWWKWKIDPFTIDAVLIYAMSGHGRRANLYTDYTFAVWKDDQLVPFAKAYSGLTDEEIRAVDRWVKQNTIEKFGPVRSVKPALVFEIAFEGIAKSTRHKSGIALRFPRINRWRKDKPIQEANTLQDLEKVLENNS